MIHQCNCKHSYQDKKYGEYRRVFNESLDKQRRLIGKCTVCSKQVELKGSPTIKL